MNPNDFLGPEDHAPAIHAMEMVITWLKTGLPLVIAATALGRFFGGIFRKPRP